jgi:hypothetical protein
MVQIRDLIGLCTNFGNFRLHVEGNPITLVQLTAHAYKYSMGLELIKHIFNTNVLHECVKPKNA